MILFSKLLELAGEAVWTENPERRKVACQHVPVEPHIWGSLALHSGMPYHMVLYENQRGVLGNEIFCTAYAPHRWHELWKLKVRFFDRPGLLADLTDLLRQLDLNIVYCRGESTEPNGIVNFEMLLDAHDYTSEHPDRIGSVEGPLGETLPEVRWRVIGTFIDQIVFYKNEPLFSLRRILPLVMAHGSKRDPRPLPLAEGQIPLPVEFLDRIRKAPHLAGEAPQGGMVRAAMRADTEAAVIRIMILFPNTRHLVLRLLHEDKPGTLATISACMRQQNYNMLQMRTDYESPGAVTELILSVPRGDPPILDHAAAVKIRDLIRAMPKVDDCDIVWDGT